MLPMEGRYFVPILQGDARWRVVFVAGRVPLLRPFRLGAPVPLYASVMFEEICDTEDCFGKATFHGEESE